MDETSEILSEVRTRFIQSNLCRTIRMDGAWGGLTPQGLIHMAIYNERWDGPTEGTVPIGPDGRNLAEIPDEVEPRVIREVEANIFMSLAAAVSLRDWLDRRITELEELSK